VEMGKRKKRLEEECERIGWVVRELAGWAG
jgi:hypothetical protein